MGGRVTAGERPAGGRANRAVADRLGAEVGFPVEAVRGGYVVWHGGPHPCRTAREVRAVARRLRAAGAGEVRA